MTYFIHKFITGNHISNNLYNGIYFGQVKQVNDIIDSYGFSYEPQWEEGYDLLCVAINSRNMDVAKLLVKKNCKLEGVGRGQSKSFKSLIRVAISHGDAELVGMLLERDTRKMWLEDLLVHQAVYAGRRDIVRLLLERGANVETRNLAMMTALHLAAVQGHADIVKELLTSGADIESQDRDGRTSLFLAVSAGHKMVVKELLEQGADHECKFNGLKPLYVAASKGYVDIFRTLLAFGADFDGTNDFGQTPLHIACVKRRDVLVSSLLEAGADVNATDLKGMVPGNAVYKRGNSYRNFSRSTVPFMLAKHFSALKAGGLFLNEENNKVLQSFAHRLFLTFSDNDAYIQGSEFLDSTMECCKAEICKMKKIKNGSGFSVYNIFQKIERPTAIVTVKEISFLESIDLDNELPNYKHILRRFITRAKERRSLVSSGEEWFSLFLNHSGDGPVTLPQEVRLMIVSFLNDEELKQLIFCGKQLF
uniref:PRANC domain-containing protein n=1 Tax=Graphocephala atropunctata TaxID=36148 RepID=A0A1B6KEE8_9HEMI